MDDLEIRNEIFCPACGSPCCDIVSAPRPGSWFGHFGKARCADCRITFTIELADEADE